MFINSIYIIFDESKREFILKMLIEIGFDINVYLMLTKMMFDQKRYKEALQFTEIMYKH